MSAKDYYIIHFAIAHHNFRIPELLAVAECLGCEIDLPADEEEMETDRPFMVVKLNNDDDARRLLTRCILIKYVSFLAFFCVRFVNVFTYSQGDICTLGPRENLR